MASPPACRKTLREGAAIIDPEEDYMTIAAAEEQMSLTEAARRRDVEQAKTKLRGHLRALDTRPWLTTRAQSSHGRWRPPACPPHARPPSRLQTRTPRR